MEESRILVNQEQSENPNQIKTKRNKTRNQEIWNEGYGPRSMTM